MPGSTLFLEGFGLTVGRQFGQFKLIKATATHETITRYHDYQYRIKLTLLSFSSVIPISTISIL